MTQMAEELVQKPQPQEPPPRPRVHLSRPLSELVRPENEQPPETAITVGGFNAWYGTFQALHDVTLEIPACRVTALIGPSGCGKTTTMKMVNRLIEPSSGCIVVAGTNIMQHDPIELRRQIGYAIQHIGLFPHMTVAENIAQPSSGSSGIPQGLCKSCFNLSSASPTTQVHSIVIPAKAPNPKHQAS